MATLEKWAWRLWIVVISLTGVTHLLDWSIDVGWGFVVGLTWLHAWRRATGVSDE